MHVTKNVLTSDKLHNIIIIPRKNQHKLKALDQHVVRQQKGLAWLSGWQTVYWSTCDTFIYLTYIRLLLAERGGGGRANIYAIMIRALQELVSSPLDRWPHRPQASLGKKWQGGTRRECLTNNGCVGTQWWTLTWFAWKQQQEAKKQLLEYHPQPLENILINDDQF